jgi:hypothetical protein
MSSFFGVSVSFIPSVNWDCARHATGEIRKIIANRAVNLEMLIDLPFGRESPPPLAAVLKRNDVGESRKPSVLGFRGLQGSTLNNFYTRFDAICLSGLRQAEGYFRSVVNGRNLSFH